MKITFLGATKTVTGSNFLVETENGIKFLVDCGMYQGHGDIEEKNYDKLKGIIFLEDDKSIQNKIDVDLNIEKIDSFLDYFEIDSKIIKKENALIL